MDLYRGQKQVALDKLCERILAGEVEPGARISERALARELGMSIIPVREALAHLTAVGVFVKVPHFGTFAQRLAPEAMEEFADFRVVAYTYAIGRAAADPESRALLDLKEAADSFLRMAQAATEWDDWGAASPEEWREHTTSVARAMLEILWAVLRTARMDAHLETYRQADLLHIMLARHAWRFLTRQSLIDHLRVAYVERPMGGFVPAIEARDIARAQRFHLERSLFTKNDLLARLEAAGAPRPKARQGRRISLTDIHFTFGVR
jgi:DNA-binding GntR family transcriptional regulator